MRYVFGLLLVCSPAPLVAQTGTIGLNFTGVTLADGMTLNSNSGYGPPDNGGAAGPNHVAQLINGAFAVYDKSTGNQTQLIAGKQFWINAGVDPGNEILNLGSFNQRILYDPTVDRWIAAGLTGESTDNRVMIARSDTTDPSGAWKAVEFLGNDGLTGKFADFTTLGVDADGVYVATNNFPGNFNGAGFEYAMLFSLPKSDLLATTPTTANMTQFGAFEFNISGLSSIQPIVDFGPSKGHAPLLSIVPVAPPTTPLYRVDLSGTSGPGATTSAQDDIAVASYVVPPAAAQPDATRSISTIDGRIASHVLQVGDTIYSVRNTALDGNVGLSVTILDEPTSSLIQEIVLANADFDYFNASIAANHLGDVVVGFTRSGFGEGGNLSAYAVVGHSAGGVTMFGEPFLLKEGLAGDYHEFNNRWGDWTTTVVDPSDPHVFWTFQQYALASDAWATQITQIIVPEPGGMVLTAAAIVVLFCVARRRHRRRAARGI